MLTDTKLRSLKAQDKLYKVNDRDGLYVAVTPAGAISFRYNYSIMRIRATVFQVSRLEPYALPRCSNARPPFYGVKTYGKVAFGHHDRAERRSRCSSANLSKGLE